VPGSFFNQNETEPIMPGLEPAFFSAGAGKGLAQGRKQRLRAVKVLADRGAGCDTVAIRRPSTGLFGKHQGRRANWKNVSAAGIDIASVAREPGS
jgi:hypothetical protein